MAQIKDLKRMCKSYQCANCPFYNYCKPTELSFSNISDLPDNADEIVDNWVKEHPVKTYALDFFEKFPNAMKDEDGLPKFCVEEIYGIKYENCGCGDCHECIKCWNREMKGDD